jgi:large-conductance mechanosensitive channel
VRVQPEEHGLPEGEIIDIGIAIVFGSNFQKIISIVIGDEMS